MALFVKDTKGLESTVLLHLSMHLTFTEHLLCKWTIVRVKLVAQISTSLKRRGRETMHDPAPILCEE